MDIKLDMVQAITAKTHELDRVPTRDEFVKVSFTKRQINNVFGSYSALVDAAGLKKYRSKKPLIEDQNELNKPPVIMYLDIETAPIEARVWGRWDQNISMNQITRDWFVMSFAAEVDGVMHQLDQRFSNPIEDDSMLITAIHHLLNQADIVYSWNGESFDLKKLNARFLKHGMSPIGRFRSIDGLRVVKRKFALTSNKLDDVAKYLGVEGKLHSDKFIGQELWNQCLAGNMEAWEDMARYNVQDVVVLKNVMKVIDVWHSKINFGMFESESKCSCGSIRFASNGIVVTNSGKFQKFTCMTCGRYFRSKKNLMHPDSRKEILI